MNFASIVERLRAEPAAFLDNFCAASLGAFLTGYANADTSTYIAIKALLGVFPGADQANACSCAYLSYSDGAAGASAILSALEKILGKGDLRPEVGPFGDLSFVEVVRGPIIGGRSAMILGEPTVITLYNYVNGYLCGMEAVLPVEAASQARDLSEFERWLQGKYKVPGAAWYKIIRIYEGACERGLTRFIELWDAFAKERLNVTPRRAPS
jgi:hypothetical protein